MELRRPAAFGELIVLATLAMAAEEAMPHGTSSGHERQRGAGYTVLGGSMARGSVCCGHG